MPSPNIPVFRNLLGSILSILETLLPDFLEQDLKSPAVRESIVTLADIALTRQFPLARLLPAEHRRKVIRKALDLILDDLVLHETAAVAELTGSEFEGLIVTTAESGTAGLSAVQQAVAATLGGAWHVKPLSVSPDTFHVTTANRTVSVGKAWESVYALRSAPRIIAVEPDFTLPAPVDAAPEAAFEIASAGGGNLPESDDCEWSLKIVRAREAWQFSDSEGRPSRGEGIIVGHPDTGYTLHPENWDDDPAQNRLLFRSGFDFFRNDADAVDDLDSPISSAGSAGFIGFPGHGTGTSSVIFSGDGPFGGVHVTGTAPAAKLIPFRVAPTVVLWNQRRLADAIKRATDTGCHVISISMGGLSSNYLHKAVQYAAGHGVIVCCAAGNYFGASDLFSVVVWPAAYEEAVGVAGSNSVNKSWSGSSRGKQVDISAPGESVWHARASKDQPLRDVSRSSGTSFAVATLAGIAACWLAHHGRKNLIDHYSAPAIPNVFRELLATHGNDRPAGWDTKRFGPGIVNAEKLLRAPLPPVGATIEFAMAEEGPSERLGKLFEGVPRAELRAGFSRLLKTPEPALNARLDELGDELAFHFFNDPVLRQRFQQELTGESAELAAATAAEGPDPKTLLKRNASGQLAAAIAGF
jgi:serine protease